MKYLYKILILSTLSVFLSFSVQAQSKSPAAEADKAFESFQYKLAAELYKKAYSKIRRNPVEKRRVMFQMAESYTLSNDLKKAEKEYLRLEKVNYQKDNPMIYIRLGDIYRIKREYTKALEYYKKYKEYNPDDPRSDERIEAAIIAAEWINNPTRHEVENMKRFNTPQSEWSTAWGLPNKRNQIVFTSSRESTSNKKMDEWSGQAYSDLFVSNRPKSKISDFPGEWTAPVLLDEAGIINSDANEGEATFNFKGTTIYFSKCPNIKREVSYCKIYTATRKGKSWGEPQLIELGPDGHDYVHPVISNDELTLFFVSDMPGTNGGYDIWKTTRTKKNKPFETPVNLGTNINTADQEMFPSLRNDSTLYFASRGHIGLGGYDIFVSHLVDDEWTKAENLKYPINSEGDDWGILFDESVVIDPASGFPLIEKGFLTSNRQGGRGEEDIWYFKLVPIIFTLSGWVKDSVTMQYIDGATVTVTCDDGCKYETTTDIRGRYYFDKTKILAENTYNIHVAKNGYYDNENCNGKETTVGLTENTDLIHNFILNPIPKDPIVLPDILYDLGKWFLRPEAKDSIMALYKILVDNPTFVIELRSHTDIRPIPMTNDTLSQRRAESVVNFLIDSLKIDPERLVAKGYGERIPRTLERDIVSRGYTFKKGTVLTPEYIKSLKTRTEQEAAHDLNRRTEFLVLRDDFEPRTEFVTPEGGYDVKIVQEEFIPVEINDGQVRGKCYLNNKTVTFFIDSNAGEKVNISYDQAMRFLKQAIITVGDFDLQKDAINEEDGSIKDSSIVYLHTLTIGGETLENVEMTVVRGQKDPIVIGDAKFREEFGNYRLDPAEQILIFEEE